MAASTGDRPGGGPPLSFSEVGEEKVWQDPSRATAEPVRGFLKLSSAVRAFNFDFRGKTVLDIGSSTGGFTELALKNGAQKVIAVEKGSHQMKAPLRFDPRVELHEKTDIFNVWVQDKTFEGPAERGSASMSGVRPWRRAGRTQPEKVLICTPHIIMVDVSFLSLTRILKYAKEHLSNKDTEFLAMLKPQFEAQDDQLHKGIVKNETIRRAIIKKFEQWLKQNNFIIVKKRDNDLAGRHGNIERFYYLKLAK